MSERIKGLVNCSVNFEVNKTAPLDSRTVVATVLGLTQTDTWQVDGKVWLYDGLVVSVTENNGLYQLKGFSEDPLAYASAENWVRLDAGAVESVEVENQLDSTSTTKALSAKQGKVLNDKIEDIKSSISSVYNYKGSVNTLADLPTTDVKVGDVYNVGTSADGPNYAWNGTEWDMLGGAVDLSGYYTKTEVDTAIEDAVNSVDISDQLVEIKESIDENTSALQVINGENEGSLKKVYSNATEYTDTQLLNYVQKETGKSLISSDKLALIDTNASDIASLEERVEANEAKLTILTGDVDKTGSVLNIVNNQITAALEWHEIE